jgi:hypothetical protein
MPARLVYLATLSLLVSFAPSQSWAEATIEFNRDIRPILSDRCFSCHGPDSGSREADLRLDTFDGATDWAIVPGGPDDSEVIARIVTDDPDMVMPPPSAEKPALTKKEIDLLKKWVEQGAEYEKLWSYLPVERVEPVKSKDDKWSRTPIDRFLYERFQREGVTPNPEADRRTLARRLYFDLTGLPPTAAEVAEFEADNRPDAYERLVDKLLASPHYGERMAQWWFDLVRFANTVGYHGDQIHSAIPYRDYVIKSFNDNTPFDQFTIEQLAGDLVENPTMWQKVATGYNRLLQTTHEGGAQNKEYLAIHLADRVRNVGEVWLATSTGCAQCHDHKFDPISLRDFYSLGAFFADVDHYGSFASVSGNIEYTERPPEILAWTLPTYEEIQKLDQEIGKVEGKLHGRITSDWQKLRGELAALKTKRVELEGQFVRALVTEAIKKPHVVRVLNRGNWMDETGEIVEPAVPHFLDQIDTDGRRATRLDLANWLVDGKNPLVARTVMNRLWAVYYGRGIAESLIDLGSQSSPPDHPELLDWLASEYVRTGWNTKKMIRLLVTSSAYRQSSVPTDEAMELDPKNVLIARQGRWRLDAEYIRDNSLAASGLLNLAVGGESGRPYQPTGYYAQLNFPEREYKPATDELQYRRGVYTHWQRQFLHPAMVAFDAPSREECTAKRATSNTPSAALVLLNDPTYVESSRVLAERVLAEAKGSDRERIDWLWHHVLNRDASPDEADSVLALVEKHRQEYESNPAAAEQITSIGLSKTVGDEQVVEVAAWTSACRVLMNLSETITRN